VSPARYAGRALLLHRSNLVSHIGRLYVHNFLLSVHNELTFEALVVSCAQSPISSLQGESISIIQNPATESATTFSQNILIYSKNSLVWSLPVDECQDWFVRIYYSPGFRYTHIYQSFVSHFWEYWPRPFQITHHEKVITAEDWPKIFVIAKKSGLRLSIEFR
jgi:hypothetical protein